MWAACYGLRMFLGFELSTAGLSQFLHISICICIYTYRCIHIHMYIYTHLHMHMCIHSINTYISMCIHIYIYVNINTNVHRESGAHTTTTMIAGIFEVSSSSISRGLRSCIAFHATEARIRSQSPRACAGVVSRQ